MVKLNAEKDTVTAAHYRVKSYPTIMVLKKDGSEIDRVVGYYHPREFMDQVEDYLAGRNTLASYAAMEPDSGKDPGYVGRLAERYFYHGLNDEARQRYLKLLTMDPQNKSELVDDALYTLARMSRKEKDYAQDAKYAQMIIERYPHSDMYKSAILEKAGALRRDMKLAQARTIYLDYAKRFPADEDAAWAKEQADTLSVKIQHGEGA
jgi:thioredoxin-like negative regulator of GroEL